MRKNSGTKVSHPQGVGLGLSLLPCSQVSLWRASLEIWKEAPKTQDQGLLQKVTLAQLSIPCSASATAPTHCPEHWSCCVPNTTHLSKISSRGNKKKAEDSTKRGPRPHGTVLCCLLNYSPGEIICGGGSEHCVLQAESPLFLLESFCKAVFFQTILSEVECFFLTHK